MYVGHGPLYPSVWLRYSSEVADVPISASMENTIHRVIAEGEKIFEKWSVLILRSLCCRCNASRSRGGRDLTSDCDRDFVAYSTIAARQRRQPSCALINPAAGRYARYAWEFEDPARVNNQMMVARYIILRNLNRSF